MNREPNPARETALAIAAILAGGLLAFWAIRSHAAPPAIALEDAKAAGYLPAWADTGDSWWSVSRKEATTFYVYDCLQDRGTGALWIIRTRRFSRRQHLEGVTAWDLATPTIPLTAAQASVCQAAATVAGVTP